MMDEWLTYSVLRLFMVVAACAFVGRSSGALVCHGKIQDQVF